MTPVSKPDGPAVYQITVRGALGEDWSGWFGGLAIIPDANGNTQIEGAIRDQAELHGLLNRTRDLGLILLSVRLVQEATVDEPTMRNKEEVK